MAPLAAGAGLLLVDVNNSFFDPRGIFYYPRTVEVLQPLRQLLAVARSGCRLVVHAREAHRTGLDDFETMKLPEHCLAGSFDAAAFAGFEELQSEIVIPKRRYSAFFGTDLALVLREQGIGRLVIAGVKTNVCIRATVQDAFAYGFCPTVVRQAVNSNRPHLHEAALEDIARYFGDVIHLDDALHLLASEAAGGGAAE